MLEQCDELISAEWVVTVDGARRVIEHGAVAVVGDTVADVGPLTDIGVAWSPQRRTHLPGHLLMPGMVNAHTHLAMTLFRGIADDRDLADFLGVVIPAEDGLLDAALVECATEAAAVESLRAGVTSALDMYFFCDAALTASRRVGLRVMTGPVLLESAGPDRMARRDRLAWSGDWLASNPPTRGFRPVVGPHSTYLVDPSTLEHGGDLAARHGATVHIHAAETAAEVRDVRERFGRTPVALLGHLGLLGPSTVLAHGVHLSDEEIDPIVSSGAHVAHCPGSNLKLAAGVARIPELLARGGSVALGTDGPASSNDLDLLGVVRLAALLHKGVSGDPTVLDAATVVEMATLGGARALGLDADLGSIEEGKLADLVAVDLSGVHHEPVHDPVSALVYAAGRSDVRHVWVGGRTVVEDGHVVTVDEQRTAARMRELRPVVSRFRP